MKLPSFLNQGDRPDRGGSLKGRGHLVTRGRGLPPRSRRRGGLKRGFEVGGRGACSKNGGVERGGAALKYPGFYEEGKKGVASCKHTRGEETELGAKDSTRLGGRLRCRGVCLFKEGGAVEEAEGGQEARGCF